MGSTARFLCPRVLERVKGIEPSYAAWEAAVLPLNYTRVALDFSAHTPIAPRTRSGMPSA
jgi:hypothetical protein